MSLAPEERRRRALIAVLLAGLAPPGGHVYVGRPLRGFVLLLLSFGAGLAWVGVTVTVCVTAALLFGLCYWTVAAARRPALTPAKGW